MSRHVLIVEDEPLIAKDLSFILEDMGINQIELALSYEDALEALSTKNFDLLLLDVNLSSEHDGIDLAHHINKEVKTPFIFVTSYYNASTVARAKITQPLAYLLKPFNQHDIRINVEMALYKSEQEKEDSNVYLRGQFGSIHLELNEIILLEAQDNYTEIVTHSEKHVASQTLKSILEKLPESQFVRTHKSYAIRLEEISMIKGGYIYLEEYKVPIGRSYKEAFQERISII